MKPILKLPAFLPASLLFVLSAIVIIPACKKEKVSVVEIAEARNGNVWTYNANYTSSNQPIDIITIKSSPGSGTAKVKLVKDDAAVATKGARLLPTANYSLTTLEFDLPPGGSVNVPITLINVTSLTLDTLYGIGLKIESVTGATIDNAAQSIVVRFDFRNRFDGRYRITGTMVDIASPTLTGYFPQDVDLITTGPNTVTMIPRDLGIPGYLILSGTSLSYYGSFGPVFTFNLTNNKIATVTNSYGQPASNTRSAEIDPTGMNQFNPTTKQIAVKFYMKQPNTVTTAPHIRVYFDNTITFLGPRFKN